MTVSGIYYVGGEKIQITNRKVEIDDVPRQTINGADIHDAIFVGTCNITLTDNGIKLYNSSNPFSEIGT